MLLSEIGRMTVTKPRNNCLPSNSRTYSQPPPLQPPGFFTPSETIKPELGMRRKAKLPDKPAHWANLHAENPITRLFSISAHSVTEQRRGYQVKLGSAYAGQRGEVRCANALAKAVAARSALCCAEAEMRQAFV